FGWLRHDALNKTIYSNETVTLYYTFSSVTLFFKWQQCCTEAILCCANYHKKYHNLHRTNQQLSNMDGTVSKKPFFSWTVSDNHSEATQMCPPTWDGWLCWDEYARPNQVLEQSCPKHIYWHQLVPPCRG